MNWIWKVSFLLWKQPSCSHGVAWYVWRITGCHLFLPDPKGFIRPYESEYFQGKILQNELAKSATGWKPTIEFRQHRSIKDAVKITAWVWFCVLFGVNVATLPPFDRQRCNIQVSFCEHHSVPYFAGILCKEKIGGWSWSCTWMRQWLLFKLKKG